MVDSEQDLRVPQYFYYVTETNIRRSLGGQDAKGLLGESKKLHVAD